MLYTYHFLLIKWLAMKTDSEMTTVVGWDTELCSVFLHAVTIKFYPIVICLFI